MNIEKLRHLLAQLEETTLCENLKSLVDDHREIIILGNGGSNSIASHIAQDYTKVLGKKAISFSDPSRLTCYINDYGQDEAFTMFLRQLERPRSLVILISSSGESKNIINCLKYCQDVETKHVVLTGFNENNTLREKAENTASINYWVDSDDYGIVECLHQIFLHSTI
tara:strand:- start:4495 stop:4998 length:504 start_codon:yes stop_codon:yes gene_type:complete